MKQTSGPLHALINSSRAQAKAGLPSGLVFYDLYTITLTSGLVLTYTTALFPITAPNATIFNVPKADGSGGAWFAGITWTPFPIDVKDSKATGHWKVGLDADQWQVEITPRPNVSPALTYDMIGSLPWLAAAAGGALDNADCVVSRAYFAAQPTWGAIPSGGAVPVGTLVQFRGYLSEIDCTVSSAVLTVNDYRLLMQSQMPRNYYMPQCRFRFGSARCGVDLSAYTHTGSSIAQSSAAQIVAAGPAPNPGGSGTYAQGYLKMLTGHNAGFSRGVRSWDGGATFGLVAPFPFAVNAGDGFSVVAGCNKSTANCASFSNLPNFGGTPFVPTPEVSLG